MDKKIIKILPSLAILLASVFLLVGSLYAWYIISVEINSLKFKIAKIDSVINVSQAIDSNFNGIPDLNEDDNFMFGTPCDDQNALSNEDFTNVNVNMVMKDYDYASSALTNVHAMMPTQTYTFKLSVLNRSETNNYIKFMFKEFNQTVYENYDQSISTTQYLNFLKILSVRIGKVGENSRPIFQDKKYFADFLKTNAQGEYEVDGNGSYIFDQMILMENLKIGGLNENSEGVNFDFWIQFKFESLEDLKANASEFAVLPTSVQYSEMQNIRLLLPIFRIYLEVPDAT